MALNLARQFPAGIQLLNTLLPTDSTNAASLSSIAGLVDGALLFVWNGSDVNGVVIPDDVFIEPVVLEIQTQRLDKLGSPYQVVQTGCEGNRKDRSLVLSSFACKQKRRFALHFVSNYLFPHLLILLLFLNSLLQTGVVSSHLSQIYAPLRASSSVTWNTKRECFP